MSKYTRLFETIGGIAAETKTEKNIDVATVYDEKTRARLVACWNACEGIEDPAKLREQRDELLEALKKLDDVARQLANECVKTLTPDMKSGTMQYMVHEILVDSCGARAVIAKAEGRNFAPN